MKFGIYYSYWEQEWSADCLKYVEKVARLGFDIIEIAAHHLNSYSPAHIAEVGALRPRQWPHYHRGARPVAAKEPVLRRSSDPKSGARVLRRDARQPRQTRHSHHRRRPPFLLADRLFQARRQGGGPGAGPRRHFEPGGFRRGSRRHPLSGSAQPVREPRSEHRR